MNFKINKYKDLIIAILVIVVITLILLKVFNNLNILTGFIEKIVSLSMPFIYGMVIAYVLNPIVKLIQKKLNISRNISIIATYAIFVFIVSNIIVFGLPSLVSSIRTIIGDIPNYIKSVEVYINEIFKNEQIAGFINDTNLLSAIENYIGKIGTLGVNFLTNSFETIFTFSSAIIRLILGALISIYVLVEKDKLIKDFKRVLVLIVKEEKAKRVIEFGRVYHDMIGTYIGIKAIDSTIIGSMAFILLSIVKSEYALLLAIIVGITNMIPYFGPFIGEIVGFLINVFVSPTKGVMVFLALFSLQMFDGWYLDPKLIGDKVGVRPFWIIYSVVIGGGFFGPLGMLLASPTAATIKIYYVRLLEKKKELIKTVE